MAIVKECLRSSTAQPVRAASNEHASHTCFPSISCLVLSYGQIPAVLPVTSARLPFQFQTIDTPSQMPVFIHSSIRVPRYLNAKVTFTPPEPTAGSSPEGSS